MSTLDAPPRPAPAGAAERGRDQRRERDPEGREGPRRRPRASSSSALHEPPKAAVQAGRGRRRARRSSSSTRRPSARPTRPSSRSPTRPSSRCDAHRGRAGAGHGRGVHGLRGGRAGRPRLAGGDAPARDRGLLAGDGRPVGGELHRARGRPVASAGSSRPLTWLRSEPGEHGYARPIEGLVVTSSTSTRWRSSRSTTTASSRSRPSPATTTSERMFGAGQRAALRRRRDRTSSRSRSPSPRAPSFTVDGPRTSRWQKWHAAGRASRRARASSCTSSATTGTRPIIYRASLAEMFVPYGDPAPTHRFKNVFDQGEYGVGWLANPLDARLRLRRRDPLLRRRRQRPGRRAGRRSRTPSACTRRTTGSAGSTRTSAPRTVEVRRLRRLVISIDRHRRQLRVRVLLVPLHRRHDRVRGQAHGRDLDRRARAPGERPAHGTLVAPGLYGPHHQHFFCVRLDMAVDGNANTVVEVDSEPLPVGPGQPDRQRLGDQARRCWRPRRGRAARSTRCAGRFWRIESPEQGRPRWATRSPTSSMPGENVAPMFAPDARYAQRAGLHRATHAVGHGVRPDRALRAPATTRTSTPAATALPALRGGRPRHRGHGRRASGTRSAPTTSSRPEDWPVMPVTHVGFKLKPAGFFAGNPALDMPPSARRTAVTA